MPEILGDAAIWVDPLSVESIAEGVGTALLDKKARSAAIAKGLLRVEEFSWEKMSSETVNVYRAAANCPFVTTVAPGLATARVERE